MPRFDSEVLRDAGFSALVTTAIFFVVTATSAFAALSCSVTTTCNSPSVVVFRMNAETNSHAELPGQTNYSNLVCCDAPGASLSNSCSGAFTTIVKLSDVTNAQVELGTGVLFPNDACLSVGSGFLVTAASQASNCTGFDTTVASMSSTLNAHVGTSTAYTTKVCSSVVANSLTFLTDGSSEAFPAHTPGTLVATTSILSVKTTNATGFNITLQRVTGSGTMSLGGAGATFVPDKTAWIPGGSTIIAGNATASTTQPSTLQFRVRSAGTDALNYAIAWWGIDDTTANALFAGFPSSAQQIINRSSAAVSTTTSHVLYNLNTPVSQPTGSYSGDIIYTATANP